jgi:hypothetical protein
LDTLEKSSTKTRHPTRFLDLPPQKKFTKATVTNCLLNLIF